MPQQSLRHVPWTCRWGRFGGPVEPPGQATHGFVFWVCTHPMQDHPSVPARGACEACEWWEPGEQYQETDRATIV